jgi:excisionase family DNA binding protein
MRIVTCKEGTTVPETMNGSQAARYMKVTPQTVRNWVRTGKVKATRVGDGRKPRYVIAKADLDALLERVKDGGGCTEETF